MATSTIQKQLNAGLRARQSGRSADAQRHFAAVLTIDGTNPVARNILGLEALAAGDARMAADHFEHACQGDSEAAELWLNLAVARRALGETDSERVALEQVLSLDQRALPALIGLAQLHERLGEERSATERWGAVLTLASQIQGGSRELADLLAHARSYVERQRQKTADALDRAFAENLAGASTRDKRRARAAAEAMLGRRTIYPNQCHGLLYPFLPADEFFEREHFPWLEKIEAATDEIRSELESILAERETGFSPYVEQPSGVPDNKWSPLNHSLDWGALHLWRDGERNDAACARAPKTAALVESLPICRIPRRSPAVFFSILKAGKHIPPHTGVTNVRSIVHLPLIVPEGCTFRVGGETRPWVEGEAFVFDDTIEHEAINPTAEDRAVLIFDVWNPYLSETEQAAICRIFEINDACGEATTSASVPMRAD